MAQPMAFVQGHRWALNFQDNSITSFSRFFWVATSLTSYFFGVASSALTLNTLFGNPIFCFGDKSSEDEIKFLNSYCWIYSTFSVTNPNGNEMYPGVGPDTEEHRHHNYYQWVVFVLFIQSLLQYAPQFVWTLLEEDYMKKLLDVLEGNNWNMLFSPAERKNLAVRLAEVLFGRWQRYPSRRWTLTASDIFVLVVLEASLSKPFQNVLKQI